jgi:hypothetical protein
MKEIILEILKEYIKENINEDINNINFPFTSKTLQSLINSQYDKCNGLNDTNGCIGQITNDECKTDYGVIGGPYTEKIIFNNKNLSDWSVVNRFDTNTNVIKKIEELYNQDNNKNKSNLKKWINDNSKELFNGKYTKQLVDENKKTLEKGYQGESFAQTIIQKIYPEATIKQHCAGDIRDRKLGQDFDVIIDNINYYFQIKTINSEDIQKYNSERGYYYSIPSYNESSKYKESNVDVIMYVDIDKNPKKYVLFNNDYSKIVTVHRPYYNKNMPKFNIIYYEEPLETNIDFKEKESEPNRIIKPKLSRSKDLLIKQYQNRIKQLSQELEKLQKNENPNQTTMFEDISQQLHINKKRLKRLIG